MRKMSLTGARETSITAHRHCSWGWGTRSQLGASQPPRRRGRAAGLAGARLRLAVRALSVLSCLKQQDSRAGPRPCPPPPSLPPRPLLSLPRSGIPLGTVFLPSWPLCLEVRWSRLGLEAPSLQGHLGRFHNVPSSCFVFARPAKEHWARRHFAGEKPGLIGVARPAGGREASEPVSGLAPRGRRRWARVSRKSKPFWAPWHLAPS